MILKAKERGDANQLSRYLLARRENDHVELHDVRGFVSDDLHGAFSEADAIARGTRCRNYLFSMSLNPPQNERVNVETFEQAIAQIERKLGLENQPRAVVFHEKDGRRHAHVVWSRIDSERMRAITMSNYKLKLRDVSRKLFLENGWDMPRGLQDYRLRNPMNFTQAEWQQAKRTGLDPRELKAVLQQCWKVSDNKASFEHALMERGFWLARGNQRGFVAIDYRGEVYSLSRYAGVKTKELKARLDDPAKLLSVEETKAEIARQFGPKLEAFAQEAERKAKQRFAMLAFRKSEMLGRHQHARQTLWAAHERRWQAETKHRAERLPKGFAGLWHRLTGEYGRIRELNDREALEAFHRDRAEKDALIFSQIDERQELQHEIRQQRQIASEEMMRLRSDIANYQSLGQSEPEREHEREREKAVEDAQTRKREREQRARRRRDFEL